MADLEAQGTILVVEDAEAVRKLVCTMLGQVGYRCLEAADGVEALDVLDATLRDCALLLTDIVMPRMNGSELARRVSRIRPDLPILFMSGYSDDPSVRYIEQVPELFIAKPFTTPVLLEKVRDAIARPWTGLPEMTDSAGTQ